jgi:ribulose-phosphate 3-epimerase
MKKIVIPSIIAKNQRELDERISKVPSKIYQLDIMDGKFVKNKSLNFDFKVPRGKKYEAHLMVENPRFWIAKNLKDANTIIFHLESVKNPEGIIKLIKSRKRKVGIAINPNTPVKNIKPFLKKINMVLIMTVNPGKYGSKFLPKTVRKISEIRKLNRKIDVEVDGGIDNKTIIVSSKAGANQFVVGSYLQKNKNPKKALAELRILVK